MTTLIRNGGWPMFLLLALGFVSLAAAAYFAARPDGKHEGFIAWMSKATLWATLVGIVSDIATTLEHTVDILDANERSRIVQQGFAESMSPGIMGFSFLVLVALLAAVGRRRLDGRRDARQDARGDP
jgi:hypothetical protein